MGAVTRNQRDAGFAQHAPLRQPAFAEGAVVVRVVLRAAAKPNLDHVIGLGKLPRISVQQPLVRLLDLPAVLERLLKDAEFVANPIADGRDVQRGEGIEKAGCQPAQTAVAQPGFHVEFQQLLQTHPTAVQCPPYQFLRPGVEHVLRQLPAQQILRRKVVDKFRIRGVVGFGGPPPAVDQVVPNRVAERHVGIVFTGRLNRLSVDVVEIVDQLLPEARNRSGSPRAACLVMASIPGMRESIKKGLKTPVEKCAEEPGW